MNENDKLLLDGECGLCNRIAIFLHPFFFNVCKAKFISWIVANPIDKITGFLVLATFSSKGI